MPQFDQIGAIWASQLFWLTVFFGALFFVVGRGMLPKVVSTVDLRNSKIDSDLKAAEEARLAADKIEEAFRVDMDRHRASAMMVQSEAKAKAARATEASLAAADADIARRVELASANIAAARAAAMNELEGVASEAAVAMVARVAGLESSIDSAAEIVKKEFADG